MLHQLFPDFDFTGFPVSACTVPSTNPREHGILNAPEDDFYLGVCVDSRWPDQAELRQLRPYTAPNLPECISEGEPEIMYGWVDCGGNLFDHHGEHGIHNDDSRVLGWKKIPAFIPDLRGA